MTIILMFVAGGFMGASRWFWKRHVLNVAPELQQIEFANPVTDAQSAISKKDFHFVGVFGVGLSVPGVSFDRQERYGAKGIPGTSDCIENSEQSRLQGIAFEYAKIYNQVVLDAISAAEAKQGQEVRMKQILSKYNMFILGTVDSVASRVKDGLTDTNGWNVIVDVKEILRGENAESKKWEIFVHSPTQEFGDYKTLDDLKGRRCIWALTMKEGKILDKEALFPFQKFDDSDVEMLRKLLSESFSEKKP